VVKSECSTQKCAVCGTFVLSACSSASLVYEGLRLWTWHIGGLQPVEAESGAFDHRPDRPVQMTASADTLPCGRQPVLPSPHSDVRCQSVLDKQQPAIWFEHAAHLAERAISLRNSAKRPGHDHGVKRVAVQWDDRSRFLHERHRHGHTFCDLPGHRDEPRRRLQAHDFAHVGLVERQVQPRSDTAGRCQRSRSPSARFN
jgi:hypothetical protein